MKIGIVSDIHGNAAALSRAFDLIGDVDEMVCLGDAINQYRFSNGVVSLLMGRAATTILGNHEEAFYGPGAEAARAAAWIDRSASEWLRTRPSRLTIESCGKTVLLVHSTPWSPTGAYVTPRSAVFARFGEVAADVVLYGHIHQPVAARLGSTLIVNPGSAGQPNPIDGNDDLSCAVLDLAGDTIRHIRFST